MTFYGEKYLKNLLISDIFRTFANEHLDVSIGVRLTLYAEVAISRLIRGTGRREFLVQFR